MHYADSLCRDGVYGVWFVSKVQCAGTTCHHAGTECQHDMRAQHACTTWGHNMHAQHEGTTWEHNMRAQHEITTWGHKSYKREHVQITNSSCYRYRPNAASGQWSYGWPYIMMTYEGDISVWNGYIISLNIRQVMSTKIFTWPSQTCTAVFMNLAVVSFNKGKTVVS